MKRLMRHPELFHLGALKLRMKLRRLHYLFNPLVVEINERLVGLPNIAIIGQNIT